MKNPVPARDRQLNQRELDAIQSSFLKVRILHYASRQTVVGDAILMRLRQRGYPVTASTINQILDSMARKGWPKINAASAGKSRGERAYSLTSKGHRVLRMTRQQLTLLVATLG
jgi:DNA-binding PadR family transcriptional regulator